jgi:uncharacterized protein YndB with AHSA1/START domain
MSRTIKQSVAFSVPPTRLYRLYLSSREHAAACGWGKSKIVPKAGGRMRMAPHISGRILLLVPGRMIVQTWRGSNWKKSDLDSLLLLRLEARPGGCRLRMVHANVPDANAASITRGWHTYYWRPWRRYLKKRPTR